MLTGRKYKLLLTDEQAAYAERIGGICRSVWNTGLHQRREYRQRGAWMNYHPQAGQLAEAKREHSWLGEAPSHVLQQTLKDLDVACREHGTFRVNWRSKRRWNPSFRFPAGNHITVERLGKRKARAKLPKFGWVLFRWSRHLDGQVRSYTGARVVTVPAAYTSQTCSRCRSVDPASRESQARFRCTRCGHCENADVNAAKNVLAAGLAVSACEDLGVGRSGKQEPAGTREVLSLHPPRNTRRLESPAYRRGEDVKMEP